MCEISDYTLVSPDIGDWLATRLFEYYQSRINTRFDCTLDDLEVGYITEVQTRGRHVVGVITSLDCNVRANSAEAEVIGNVVG